MGSQREPVTAAVRRLRKAEVEYQPFIYDYRRYPGALGAAEAIGVGPHLTVKTIVLQTDAGDGVIVLMNGDREVSTKKMARLLGVKSTQPASQRNARRWTGYQFGGTSPFGTREELPIFAQTEIADLDAIYINAGSRGFVIRMSPADLVAVVNPKFVDVAA